MWATAAKISLACLLLIGGLLLVGVSLEVIGLCIGVVGLLISAIAILLGVAEGARHLGQLGVVGDQLGGVGDQLEGVHKNLGAAITELKGEVQTHHIGVFPEYLPKIIAVLEGASKSITIFCDLPAYGVVSKPDGFREYAKLIKSRAALPEFEVRILHLDEGRQKESLTNQFKDDWEKLRKKPSVAAFMEAATETLVEDDPKANFLALVEKEQVNALESFRTAGVTTVRTNQIMPLYFWIADGSPAIFALTEFSPKSYETGFSTASPRLIGAMNGIYTRYSDRGTPS